MIEWIDAVVQFLFVVWMYGVAPACTGIVVGHVLPEVIGRYSQWRANRKAQATDSRETP